MRETEMKEDEYPDVDTEGHRGGVTSIPPLAELIYEGTGCM